MKEALLNRFSAGIVLLVGIVNVMLTVYTWTLLRDIRKFLEANVYLNTRAIDLIRYGINRGYELGLDDKLKEVAMEGANLE